MMRYGMLTLVEITAERWRENVVALWRCDCGTEKRLPMIRVKSGNAKSCGCLRIKHGQGGRERSVEYVAWQAMRCRCAATKGRDYFTYKARGITVCERWRDFCNFLADMGPRPSPAHSVGRIDNDKGYEPSNCRWETAEQQQGNRRVSLVWHIHDRTFDSARAAARHFGVDPKTIARWARSSREDCHVAPRY